MSFRGTVANGTIVLDNGVQLPNGARVEVVVKSEQADSESSLGGLLE